MRFKYFLNEKSYTQEDIPKTFRVVFEIDEFDQSQMLKNIKELSDMKFEGMTGISDKHDIAFSWLGIARDAMLIMNGKEVVKLNNLTRMLYGNPNYFLSNKMKMAKRLFNKSSGVSAVLQNIMDYVFKALGKSGKVDKSLIDYSAPAQSYAYTAYKKNISINSTKDLVKWMRKAGSEVKKEEEERKFGDWHRIKIVDTIDKLSDKSIEDSIYDAFKEIGDIYQDEGEWVIKGSTFKIPKNSYLYVLVPKKEYAKMLQLKVDKPDQFKIMKFMGHTDVIEKYDFLIDSFKKYGIFKKYHVKFIDNQEWKAIQSKHLASK